MSDESTILIETAQSVAHDFIDAIIRLKATERILQERVDTNSNAALAIIQERQRQIEALTSQVIEQSDFKEDIEKYQSTITTLQGTVASLEETCASHLNAIRSLKVNLSDSEWKMDELIEKSNKAIMEKDESIKSREEAILTLNNKLDSATGNLVRLNHEWGDEKKKREDAEVLIASLTAKVDQLSKPVVMTKPKKKLW